MALLQWFLLLQFTYVYNQGYHLSLRRAFFKYRSGFKDFQANENAALAVHNFVMATGQ